MPAGGNGEEGYLVRGITSYTKVWKDKQVPVRNAKYPAIVDFSSGKHGKFEAGLYCFWTAVFKVRPYGRVKLTGRARIVLPPGDRFDRIFLERRTAKSRGAREANALWARVIEKFGIAYIRPSTLREIAMWWPGHESDTRFAAGAYLAGKFINAKSLRSAVQKPSNRV